MSFDLEKQLRFALASALTLTAKEAQAAVIADIERTFTVRNGWDKPSNAMGIRVLPAAKDDLTAAVATRADWLSLHETGGEKTPQGEHLAVPTANVRRSKREIILASQRPRALEGRSTVVLPLRRGGQMIFQRKGKGKKSRLVPLYRLIPRAHIRQQSTFTAPVAQVVEKRFSDLLFQQLVKAVRTAR
ncbi:MAG TPA: hypothetical protein VNQ79_18670 [Blastocatellia bacterium]|nr:hypothetical protein [Blastocatellia bacterium]